MADRLTNPFFQLQILITLRKATVKESMADDVSLETLLDFLRMTKDDSLRQSLMTPGNRAQIAGRFLAAASMELFDLTLPISSIKVIGVLVSRLITVLAEFAPNTNSRSVDPIDLMCRGLNKIMQLLANDTICVEPRNETRACNNSLTEHTLGLVACKSNDCIFITNCADLLRRHAAACERPWHNTPTRPFSLHLQQALPYLSNTERDICGMNNDTFGKALQEFASSADLTSRVYGGRPLELNIITIDNDENDMPELVEHQANENAESIDNEEEEEDIRQERSSEPLHPTNRRSLILKHQAETLMISAHTAQDPFTMKGFLKGEYFRHRSNLRMVLADRPNNHEFVEICQWCKNEVVKELEEGEKDVHKYQPILVQCERKCPASLMHLECLLQYSSHAIEEFKLDKTIKALTCLRCCIKETNLSYAVQLMTKREYEQMSLHLDPIVRCLFCREPCKPTKHLLDCAKSTFKPTNVDSLDIRKFAQNLRRFLGIYDDRSTPFLHLPNRQGNEHKTLRPIIAKKRLLIEVRESEQSLSFPGLLHLIKGHGYAATMLLDSNIRSCWNREFGIAIKKITEWSEVFDHSNCKLGSCLEQLSNDVFQFVASVHEAVMLFLPQEDGIAITKCIRNQRGLRSDPNCTVCDMTFDNHKVANKHFQEEDQKGGVTPWLHPFEQLIYKHLRGDRRRTHQKVSRYCDVDQIPLRMILATIRTNLANLEIQPK